MLPVFVSTLSGEALEFQADVASTLAAVQEEIARAWSVPPEFQRLALGAEVLEDAQAPLERFVAAAGKGGALRLTLIVSVDSVCAVAREGSAQARLSALSSLAAIGARAGASVVRASCWCLEDRREAIRSAALSTLSRTVVPGDALAIGEAAQRLEHPRPEVRLAAQAALELVAGRGSLAAIEAVVARLSHRGPEVREAAVVALRQVAGVGDERAMDALFETSQHDACEVVSTAAFRALLDLAPGGDERAIAAVLARLASPRAATRSEAKARLAHVVPRGDAGATRSACRFLAAAEYTDARKAALDVIIRAAPRGDEAAVAALAACVGDTCPALADRAFAGMAAICDRGDPSFASVLAARLARDDKVAQSAALAATPAAFAPGCGDVAVVAALRRLLRHACSSTRRSAARALAAVAAGDDADAIADLGAARGDASAAVRQEAMSALASIAERGATLASVAAEDGLRHPDAGVRASAVGALQRPACLGDARAVAAACAAAEDESREVQRAARRVVAAAVSCGQGPALDAVAAALASPLATARAAAADALERAAVAAQDPRRTQIILAVAGVLEHDSVEGSRLAATLLATLITAAAGPSGRAAAADGVAQRLGHPSRDVRKAAVFAADLLARDAGCSLQVARAIGPVLEAADGASRMAASEALECAAGRAAEFGAPGDAGAVVRAVLERSGSPAAEVRAIIEALLPRIVVATSLAAGRRADGCGALVRQSVHATLADFVEGRPAPPQTVVATLIRSVLAAGGDDDARWAERALTHGNAAVRFAAIEALADAAAHAGGAVAGPRTAWLAGCLREGLIDGDIDTALVAVRGLGCLSAGAVAAVAVGDAVAGVGGGTGDGSAVAMEALVSRLASEAAPGFRAVLREALEGAAARGGTQAAAAIRQCMERHGVPLHSVY